jgi:hypothetical protein
MLRSDGSGASTVKFIFSLVENPAGMFVKGLSVCCK